MEISYRDFINQVENSLLSYMPERYSGHHVRVNEIEIFGKRVELVTLLSKDTVSAPGLDLMDYFKEYLGCWDMDRVMRQMAADYQHFDRETMPHTRRPRSRGQER